MNWKRGAFRAWLVFSILWAVLIGAMIVSLWSAPNTPIPPSEQIQAAAKHGLLCVDYEQGPWNEYAEKDAIEKLKQADKDNNVPEARRLAVLITRHDKCNELASSFPVLNIIVRTSPNANLNVYAPPLGTIEGIPADVTAPALAQRISTYYASERTHEILVSIAEKAAVVILPPTFLLVMGVLTAWIIAGFRKQ